MFNNQMYSTTIRINNEMIESINIVRTVHHPVLPLPGSCQSSSKNITLWEALHCPPSSTGYVSRFPTHCSSSYPSNEYPQPQKASPVQPRDLDFAINFRHTTRSSTRTMAYNPRNKTTNPDPGSKPMSRDHDTEQTQEMESKPNK